ncbi:pseudouridine synthase [Sphingomonas sp. ac-8]|uniref:pseudouridine synthase n=1 Tax=Sphingomonas sp. ac-8 TaxID=3242977 RepID=UPI003A7FC0D4
MSTPKNPESQRIAKLLARAGVASRRDVERLIEAGRVALDGVPIETPATLLTSLRGITVDGQPVQAAAPTRLFRYHKPSGVLTAARDPHGRPTIYDRMPGGLPRLMPVGRLDLNTEGLLLLTTDGELKRQLELPATGVERTYRARAYGDVSQAQLEELMLGIEVDGVRYGPINANLERRTGTNTWIEMTLTEGKNREVRRVLEYLGLQVSRLIRTRYGPFYLEDMPTAEVDEIRQHDLVAFRKTLSGRPSSRPTPEGADPKALKAWRREPSRDRAAPRPRPVSTGAPREREVQPHPQAFRRTTPEGDAEAPRGFAKRPRAGDRAPRSDDAPRTPRGARAAAFAERTGRAGRPATEDRADRGPARGGKPGRTLSPSYGRGERSDAAEDTRGARRPEGRGAGRDRPQRDDRPARGERPTRGDAGQRPARGERPARPSRDGERPVRSDASERRPRGDFPPRPPRGDGPARPARNGPRSDRPAGPPRGAGRPKGKR